MRLLRVVSIEKDTVYNQRRRSAGKVMFDVTNAGRTEEGGGERQIRIVAARYEATARQKASAGDNGNATTTRCTTGNIMVRMASYGIDGVAWYSARQELVNATTRTGRECYGERYTRVTVSRYGVTMSLLAILYALYNIMNMRELNASDYY